MTDRKGTLVLSNMIIAMLVFSFLVVGFWTAFADMAPSYNIPVNRTFVEAFDKANETKVISEELAANVESSQASVTDSILTFVSSGVISLQIMFQSVSIIQSLAFGLTTFFGIPMNMFVLFTTVLFIAVAAAIGAALLRAPEL